MTRAGNALSCVYTLEGCVELNLISGKANVCKQLSRDGVRGHVTIT